MPTLPSRPPSKLGYPLSAWGRRAADEARRQAEARRSVARAEREKRQREERRRAAAGARGEANRTVVCTVFLCPASATCPGEDATYARLLLYLGASFAGGLRTMSNPPGRVMHLFAYFYFFKLIFGAPKKPLIAQPITP